MSDDCDEDRFIANARKILKDGIRRPHPDDPAPDMKWWSASYDNPTSYTDDEQEEGQ